MDMGQHEIIKKRPGAVGRMKTKALQGLVGPRENNSLKYLLVTNGVTALGKKTCFLYFPGYSSIPLGKQGSKILYLETVFPIIGTGLKRC